MKSFVGQKSEAFALRIVNLYRHLTDKKKEYIIAKQVLRAGTSIVANLSESDFSFSKKEYLAKVYISLKECSETLYWLRLLNNSRLITQKQFDSIYIDCEELVKLPTKTVKTLKNSLEKK
ncbi:hypothetical protein FACS189421_02930 [Bacteroidia bacterium]|nr:hypothetical protein FACS189421_02930 [Bacteroidia bacterium]